MALTQTIYYVEASKGNTDIKLPIWGLSDEQGNPDPTGDTGSAAQMAADNLNRQGWRYYTFVDIVGQATGKKTKVALPNPPKVYSEEINGDHPHYRKKHGESPGEGRH